MHKHISAKHPNSNSHSQVPYSTKSLPHVEYYGSVEVKELTTCGFKYFKCFTLSTELAASASNIISSGVHSNLFSYKFDNVLNRIQ